jgi:hypothetical protein
MLPTRIVFQRRRIAAFAVVALLVSIVISAAIPRSFLSRSAPIPTPQPVERAGPTITPGSGVVAIPANSRSAAAPIATGLESDYVWNVPPLPVSVPADLRDRLVGEVARMVQAGHLAPLPLIGGVGFASGSYSWDLGGATYGPYTLAWLNPADTILALSQAFPLLPTDQQTSLGRYMRAELDAYPIDAFDISGAYTTAKPSDGSVYYRGVRREQYALPADLTYNLWPPLRPPIDNLYALWAYANATGDWGYLEGRWPTISGLYTAFATRGTPDTYGQIGGLIGFARIARHLGHEPDAQAAADLAVRGLRSGADFAKFVQVADGRRSNTHAVSSPVFSYLTPEVGAYLRDHSRDSVAAYVADVTATGNLPTWYLAWGEQTMGGENAYLSPDVAWQIFLAKAYVLQATEHDLRRYLDQPWSIGDPYFIQKLVATMGAGG